MKDVIPSLDSGELVDGQNPIRRLPRTTLTQDHAKELSEVEVREEGEVLEVDAVEVEEAEVLEDEVVVLVDVVVQNGWASRDAKLHADGHRQCTCLLYLRLLCFNAVYFELRKMLCSISSARAVKCIFLPYHHEYIRIQLLTITN